MTIHNDETRRTTSVSASFQAPPLPQHLVARPDVTEVLKARLVQPVPSTSCRPVVTAIHGLAGSGKTTPAAALAYEKAVQERFSDGILWATLGQQPDILALLCGWIRGLRDADYFVTPILVKWAQPFTVSS